MPRPAALAAMGTSAGVLAQRIDRGGRRRREALRRRLQVVIDTLIADGVSVPAPSLAPPPATSSTRQRLDHLAALLVDARPEHLWLTLAVLDARFPTATAAQQAVRRFALDGPLAVIDLALSHGIVHKVRGRGYWPDVEVVRDSVLVDLHHTSTTTFATGIQRVARQAAQRWARDHDPVFIRWADDYGAMHLLSADERRRALHGGDAATDVGTDVRPVVVPWRCRYVLPELAAEAARANSLIGMLRFGATTGATIGFDCVPVTSSETSAEGMGGGFAMSLATARHVERIATISEGAAVEYRGWRDMLVGTGLQGPEIEPIALPVEANDSTPESIAETTDELAIPGMPMLLVVGSHEPRKNHLAVLHAAELLWREGQHFHLLLVGGNSWNSERFEERVDELRDAGRLVRTVTALSDERLWAAYRLAHAVVFPSLNEGFGLPIAEALACGTPVVTSNFGSMAEIARHGGALLVDPRDDRAIVDALRRVLVEPGLRSALAAEAARVPQRSWDRYAAETWDYLTGP